MKFPFRHVSILALAAGLWLAVFPLSLQAQGDRFPQITSQEVAKSLDENGKAWRAKIDALGHPRLLLNKEELEALKTKLMSGERSPETANLLAAAYNLAAQGPRPYQTPKEGYIDEAELWIREVGDGIVALTVAATLDPSPVLKKALHDTVLETCRYPTWGREGLHRANMDLACDHAARGVALAWDWFPDLWSAEEKKLILDTISKRVSQLLIGLYGGEFWASVYPDNHNHVNCSALGWCGAAFYTDIPQAPEWLAGARLDFQNVAKYYPADGSSNEGVPYWAYGMNSIIEFIEGTRRIIDSASLYQAPFLKNAAAYRLNASTCGLEGVLPWSDIWYARESGYARSLISRLAIENKDPVAAWLAGQFPRPTAVHDHLAFMALWQIPEGKMPTLPLDHHQEVSDIVTTRSGWGPGDYLLSIKSGFTNRNHSHLDAGALALAFGLEWLLTSSGYGNSDSPDYWDAGGKRWNFYAASTESHCALLINGRNQRFDPQARGTVSQFFSAPYGCLTDVDLTQAYKEVDSVHRVVLHRRGDYILVFDSVTPKASPPPADGSEGAKPHADVEWLAQFPHQPNRQENSLVLKNGSGQLRVNMLSPSVPFTPRQPTSPVIDVPAKNIHTYAVKQSGEKVAFTALLQPSFSKESLPPLKATVVEERPGFEHLTLQGSDWTDHVFRSEVSEEVELKVEKVKSKASLTFIRLKGREVTSCLASQATEFEIPGIMIKTFTPATLGLQQMPNGSWILDADQDIAGQVTAKNYSLQPLESKEKSFCWLLGKGGATPKEATDWLASLVVFREKAPIPVRTLAVQPQISSSVEFAVEAEDFVRQEMGNAEIVDDKPGAIGKSIRGFGNDAPDHVLSWDLDVPQSGQYQLTIRYATKLPEVAAAVLVDGAVPDAQLTKFSMPSTGGWSIKEDNWKNLVVADEQGKPFVFHLSKGHHELSLAKPAGAMNLDRFEFRGTGQ